MGEEKEYYLGLDIGTESVGFAVTDPQYNIIKKSGKSLWGMRLFDEAKVAEERRIFRSSRRRVRRKKERLGIVQKFFEEEIMKVDKDFFTRINESNFHKEDRSIFQSNSLFNDDNFKDKEFFKEFKTIYHLRSDLIQNTKKYDIRLYYIAISHIIKHRGHFLFEVSDTSSLPTLEDGFKSLVKIINIELEKEININNIDIDKISEILKSDLSKKDKATKLKSVKGFCEKDKQIIEIVNLICGITGNFEKIFLEPYKDAEIDKISFSKDNYDEIKNKIEDILEDKIVVVEAAKALYDWTLLEKTLNGKKYLSFAKVETYDSHKNQLDELKNFFKNVVSDMDKYDKMFKLKKDNKGKLVNPKNYSAYINKETTIDEFGNFVKSELKVYKNHENEDIVNYVNKVENLIDQNKYLLKQKSTENSIIPYQLHEEELKAILNNAKEHYSFFNEVDSEGYSVCDKILATFKFRIPYYVGPLSDYHSNKGGNAWVVRKSYEKVTPWNFEKVIDLKESGEQFITKMTNYCTYLKDCKVIPKNSLLYSKFSVLNELNNLKIDNKKISVPLKQKIYNELFKSGKKVTGSSLLKYLISIGELEKGTTKLILSGFDIDFKSTLVSEKDFKEIFKDEHIEESKIEKIISAIVLFGDEKNLLKEKVLEIVGNISENKLKRILSLNYKGWGRLSKEFLTEVNGYILPDGEVISIIDAMYETNHNLMELLSNKYRYLEKIEEYNKDLEDEHSFTYDSLVKDLYTSPAVKRGIWQSLLVVKELEKINKQVPKKIFIEMARGEGEKKRTDSRKKFLLEKYKEMGKEWESWVQHLEGKEEFEFRRKKLFLYYTQMGKCMYSGEKIEFSDLFKENIYDIDHIYPRSKVKDDSILNNLVLVKKVVNENKTDIYPVGSDIQQKCRSLWKILADKGLITREKYNRLTRKDPLTDDELSGFIARQLVETRQSTKAVAEVLKKIYPDTEIVYVKAGNVSEFRQKYKFLKVREINDIHHAKDAYLNIVVGSVYHTKFTSNPINFFKNKDGKKIVYNLKKMYDFNVERNGYVAWDTEDNKTIDRVKKVMNKNDVLFTRMAREEKGGFFDQTIMPKGSGQYSIKTKDTPLSDIEKYGGYNKISGAYFMLIKHLDKKGNIQKTLEFVPVYLVKKINEDEKALDDYINSLGLSEPEILIRKVKINTLFNINGGLFHIASRTGVRIILRPAMQLIVMSEENNYIKKVNKVEQKIKSTRVANAKKKDDEKKEYKVTEHDGVSKGENIKIYDMLVDKLNNTSLGARPTTSLLESLKEKRERFVGISVEEQCEVLMQILILFECSVRTSDLTLIDGAKNSGIIRINKDLNKLDNVKIIHKSKTGFYSSEVDIKNL